MAWRRALALGALLRPPAARARFFSAEATEGLAPKTRAKPFLSTTLRDLSGVSGVVTVTLAVLGTAVTIGTILSRHEHRSDAALAKLEADLAGIVKEVDAKVAGTKESLV